MIVPYVQTSTGQVPPVTGQSSQGVVFLEHNLIANGTVINGTVPFRTVDFPSYWFNNNTRQLNGDISFSLGNSLRMIFGDTIALRGNFGAGTGNRLYGIYSLPARADQAIVYSVDMSGSVSLYVNNQTVNLLPGQTYSYNETETLKDGNGLVRIVYDHTYINHGPIARNAIQARMVA